ncbi:MAG: UDP-N-acetylmuramoyl-L-alanine--D-glutamate ligase [Longimicrobiales bacterium]
MEGSKIVVVGLGSSGRAAARLALNRGGEVYGTDLAKDAETAAAGDDLRRLGARVELGPHRLEEFSGATAVVVSPGIPPDAPVLRDLEEHGISWISELEFAFRFFEGPLIAVTGTNGKTTTAALTAHLLRESGFRVGLGGNIGAGLGPAASELALMEPAPDRYVVEASSFQLADIEWFRPDVGVVTNLAPDHLDRYPDTATYYADKKRIFDNADEGCEWVLNGDDPEVLDLARGAPGGHHHFSIAGGASAGDAGNGDDTVRDGPSAFLPDDTLVIRWTGGVEDGASGPRQLTLNRDELPLMGRHNVANALAAGLAAGLGGGRPAAMEDAFRSFPPLEHRLEPVVEEGGVLWVNDSKATNVGATVSAVESLDRPVVLLLGGKDKGEDFRRLRRALGSGGRAGDPRVRAVVAYGAAGERIAEALAEAVPLTRVTGTFEEAVEAGRAKARRGDVLLLSPACSSYDMFESYEARGRRFRELAGAAEKGGGPLVDEASGDSRGDPSDEGAT